MLHRTIKMAKFYRILIGTSSGSINDADTINQSLDVDRFENEDGNTGYQDKDRVV